jgi:ABC-type branched-subunit amino acid transport system ATPase component
VSGVSISVGPGEVVSVIGRSGGGKSIRPDGTGFVRQAAATIDKAMSTFLALANMRSRTAGMLGGGERKMLAVAPVLLVEQKASEAPTGQTVCNVDALTHPTLGREP